MKCSRSTKGVSRAKRIFQNYDEALRHSLPRKRVKYYLHCISSAFSSPSSRVAFRLFCSFFFLSASCLSYLYVFPIFHSCLSSSRFPPPYFVQLFSFLCLPCVSILFYVFSPNSLCFSSPSFLLYLLLCFPFPILFYPAPLSHFFSSPSVLYVFRHGLLFLPNSSLTLLSVFLLLPFLYFSYPTCMFSHLIFTFFFTYLSFVFVSLLHVSFPIFSSLLCPCPGSAFPCHSLRRPGVMLARL